MNILIVEDDPTSLKLLRVQLEAEGHAVLEANDGVDALALLNRQRVDAVISDILMPRMDGYRLCHEIRKHARLHDLPIIIYTSTYTSLGDKKLALDVGADKYLKKPASVETIIAALHEVIAQPHAHAAPRPEALQEIEGLKEYSGRLVSALMEKNVKLMAAEVKFRALVEQSIVGIYIIQDDRFVYVNPRMAKIFGRPEEEMTSRTLYDFLVPEDHALARENIRKRISGEVPSIHYHLRMLHQSGAVLQVEVHSSRTDYEGRPAVMGTLLDITERKRANEEKVKLENQLLQSQKMEAVGQLAGGIAHDFNNILTAIIGFSTLIDMHLSAHDPNKDHIKQVLAAADRAAELTKGLLAFSRKQVINPKPVDLNQIISKAEKFMKCIIPEDIEFKMSYKNDALIINADTGQIEQIIMNLVTNARDAMPTGGLLSIETDAVVLADDFIKAHGFGEPGHYAVLTFSDSGAGMNPEVCKNVFEPFFTTKEVGKGTGLGLSIVYGIIKQHNGFINVYSEPGKGTTFRIYLPLIQGAAENDLANGNTEVEQCGSETILLADDDFAVRELLEITLRQFGYNVITAIDGIDAVAKFTEKQTSINLLLLDVLMPKMNGKEAYDEIKKIDPAVKAIFMSGHTADIIHKRGLMDESIQFLAKPLNPRQLLVKVRNVLDGDANEE